MMDLLNQIFGLFSTVFVVVFDWFYEMASKVSDAGIFFFIMIIGIWTVYRFLVLPFMR